MATIKPKKCRCGCGVTFTPRNSMQVAATPECAIRIAKAKAVREHKQAEKVARKAVKERKEALKTRSDWMKEAQAAVNAYVRLRDADQPCISCGRHHQGQYHAGHYRSRGSHPELALNPNNIFKQCAPCNTHLSGNLVEFRRRLIQLHGQDLVDWLEGPHEPKKYTVDQLKEIIAEFKQKRRELLRNT